jgi:hypothetical protein
MEIGTVSALIGACVLLTSAVGGLLMKAFINPVKVKTERNHDTLQDHESRLRLAEKSISNYDKSTETNTLSDHDVRLRTLENSISAHEVQMGSLLKAVDQLVTKIDLLIAREYRPLNNRGDKND